MSAYIVSDYHIDVLVNFLFGNKDTIERLWMGEITRDTVGAVLVEQNYKSYNIRYPESLAIIPEYHFTPVNQQHSLVQILKACDCYDYQACEDPEYDDSLATDVIFKIRKKAIKLLPGYDDAEWELTDNLR
jgi:hypothetical protein